MRTANVGGGRESVGRRLQVSPPEPEVSPGPQWLRIEVHEDIFVFDHILHFSEYTRVQLG